jgi:anaerobic glycerol-3-phosphate dehydrogenase
MFDVLIIGGGVSGISCSLILGSAENMDFVSKEKIGYLHIKKRLLCKQLQ